MYTYVYSPEELKNYKEAYLTLSRTFSGVTTNDIALWHLNNMLADWNKAIYSFYVTWETFDEKNKKIYTDTLSQFVNWLDPVWVRSSLWTMDIWLLNWFIGYIAPQFKEEFIAIYIMKDLNNYLLNHVEWNLSLTNEEEQLQHAADVKKQLEKYAPENWQQTIPEETLAKVLSQLYKEEVMQVQKAAIDLQQEKNVKLIGVLIVSAFGIYLLSRITRRRKTA